MSLFTPRWKKFQEKVVESKLWLSENELEYLLEIIRIDRIKDKDALIIAIQKRRESSADSAVSSKITPADRKKILGKVMESLAKLRN